MERKPGRWGINRRKHAQKTMTGLTYSIDGRHEFLANVKKKQRKDARPMGSNTAGSSTKKKEGKRKREKGGIAEKENGGS